MADNAGGVPPLGRTGRRALVAHLLAPLRGQVLFMKHNLNARAIAGLSSELISVQTNVDRLVRDMESAITEADAFISAWKAE